MSKRTLRRLFVLVTLTLTLALAAPLQAEAAQRSGPAGLWGWLENLWQEGIGLLVWQQRPAPAESATKPGPLEKNCTAADPNGCPSSPSGGPSIPLCGPRGCTGG